MAAPAAARARHCPCFAKIVGSLRFGISVPGQHRAQTQLWTGGDRIQSLARPPLRSPTSAANGNTPSGGMKRPAKWSKSGARTAQIFARMKRRVMMSETEERVDTFHIRV